MQILSTIYHDFIFYTGLYLDRYPLLFPLGIVGIWRWAVWSGKEIIGAHYKPKNKRYFAKVTIVTPVYNEDPAVFTKALASWKKNEPTEIIAVIDHTDKACIKIFNTFSKSFQGARLIVTKVPGKRPALAEGIKSATSPIIALVDSDTIWEDGLLRNALPPFNDFKVAGVATYQSVLNPKTFAQKIFDIQLDLRYLHEYPFLAAGGDALVCLSGRTAIYRRDVILPMVGKLVHETFLGRPVISGDDKRLTYLVLAAGWKVAYQSNAHVYTPGMPGLPAFLKQRLRWTRNSLRSDIKALAQGWPLRHPALLFYQVDKFFQSFVAVLSPIFFTIALLYQEWVTALVILVWWIVSRTIKMHHHLSKRPSDILILPGFILMTFLMGVLRIYALFTLNTQGWITRWDKSRMRELKFLFKIPPYTATALVIFGLFYLVNFYKQTTYFRPLAARNAIIESALKRGNESDVLGASISTAIPIKKLLVSSYVTVKGDTIASVATKYKVDPVQLLLANDAKVANASLLPAGLKLSIPGKDTALVKDETVKYKPSDEELGVLYDRVTNTIVIKGRGKHLTFKELYNKVGKNYFEDEGNGVWYIKSSIYAYKGVTLEFDKKDVKWLKLKSDKEGFITIRTRNADLGFNGVKVTSWDKSKNNFDKNMNDGRAFIMARDNSRMDIYSSEFAYLGYATSPELTVSPYGVSWKISTTALKKKLLTGEVVASKFHDNYFGAYTYGATGITFRENEFYKNYRYGLDPHDDSNGFLVVNNRAHDNGTHGIIFSKRCMYNIVINNYSYNNKLHGIMLHETSDNNIIRDNLVVGNTSGIALWHSSNNLVINNTIRDNRHGIRANSGANENILQNNQISGSKLFGFYLYDNAIKNTIRGNELNNNDVAMYIKSSDNKIIDNNLYDNSIGVYLVDKAEKNLISGNQIKQSLAYGIYTKIAQDLSNTLGTNTLSRNRKNVVGE